MSISPDGCLQMFTIFRYPADFPDAPFLVRRFVIRDGEALPEDVIGRADTLEGARALVPPESDSCITRSTEDQPHVVESWL